MDDIHCARTNPAGHYEYDQKTFSYGLNGSLDFIQCESQDRILELGIQ